MFFGPLFYGPLTPTKGPEILIKGAGPCAFNGWKGFPCLACIYIYIIFCSSIKREKICFYPITVIYVLSGLGKAGDCLSCLMHG